MFLDPEDLALESGPIWHGAAIGWPSEIDTRIKKLPIVSNRFCGVLYSEGNTNILSYSAYLPTSGRDEEFLEIIDILTRDIFTHMEDNTAIIIGADTNQSVKSTPRRTECMDLFLKQFSLKYIMTNDEPTFHHHNQISESQIDHIYYFIPGQISTRITVKEHLC